MVRRKKIEIYSAHCACCREVEALLRRIAGADHDIVVCDMFHARIANEAYRLGIKSVPAVVIDGQRAPHNGDRGFDEAFIRFILA